jgi:hypothetical protein
MARSIPSPSVTGRIDILATHFAGRLALISFATAALRGLACGADFFGTIQNALIALGAFYVLGLVIGEAARLIVEENARSELTRLQNAESGKGPSRGA